MVSFQSFRGVDGLGRRLGEHEMGMFPNYSRSRSRVASFPHRLPDCILTAAGEHDDGWKARSFPGEYTGGVGPPQGMPGIVAFRLVRQAELRITKSRAAAHRSLDPCHAAGPLFTPPARARKAIAPGFKAWRRAP